MSRQTLDVLDAAHTIRYHLEELLDDTDAETFGPKLDTLLRKAESDEEAEDDIEELLCDDERTREWTDGFLNADETRRSFSDQKLPGEDSCGDTGRMEKYVCPEENCREFWYRWKIGLSVPKCHYHPSVVLVPADTRPRT